MSRRAKSEYFKKLYGRYRTAPKGAKQKMLDEFCQVCEYNRKYAIRTLNGPPPRAKPKRTRPRLRSATYHATMVSILREVWEAAGIPGRSA